jgi:hypothetical protein
MNQFDLRSLRHKRKTDFSSLPHRILLNQPQSDFSFSALLEKHKRTDKNKWERPCPI